jgi:cytosine/adenosine deaminase-related metal-dependent hydrolase
MPEDIDPAVLHDAIMSVTPADLAARAATVLEEMGKSGSTSTGNTHCITLPMHGEEFFT